MTTLDRCRCEWEIIAWPNRLLTQSHRQTGVGLLTDAAAAPEEGGDVDRPMPDVTMNGVWPGWRNRGDSLFREQLLRAAANASSADDVGLETWLADYRSTTDSTDERSVDELRLRSMPARDQWLGYGRGLLKAMASQLADRGIPLKSPPTAGQTERPFVRIVPIMPLGPRGGAVAVSPNTIFWEAHLFNPLPGVPEVIRLAAAVALLHVDEAGRDTNFRAVVISAALSAGQTLDLVPSTDKALAEVQGGWVDLVPT